jgi:hypothetical protein
MLTEVGDKLENAKNNFRDTLEDMVGGFVKEVNFFYHMVSTGGTFHSDVLQISLLKKTSTVQERISSSRGIGIIHLNATNILVMILLATGHLGGCTVYYV